MKSDSTKPTIEDLLPLAEAGDAKAQFDLGNLYDAPDNSSSVESIQKALAWYEKAAAQSHPKAAEHAGYVILNGLAGEIDHARALRWLRPASEAGSAWASDLIATSYFRGQGISADPEEALVWFERGAEQGSAEALFRLGYASAKGIGTPRDLDKAIDWFRKGAALGNSPSLACLGALAWAGLGMERDFTAAKGWFEQAMATRGGNSWAPYMLGIMSENGQGVPRDMAAAEAYYAKAAAAGYYQAKIRCSLLHARGCDVPRYDEELKWMISGSESGNPINQFVLGLAREQGYESPADPAEALVWLTLAADFEMSAAADLAEQLRSELSEADLNRADKRIREVRARTADTGVNVF